MAYDYSRAVKTAERLLARFGRPMQIISTTTTPGPDAAFDPGSATTTRAAVDVIGVQNEASTGEADGRLVAVGMRAYTFGPDVVVSASDRVRDEGVEWSIVAVRDVKPGPVLITRRVFVEQ